ncbi:MAG: tripartite tricarboxylate transporter permease, partial [Bacillota bacterium]|nr:tripartite tricarboxylate transporter permease [Bacillota bacterium]
MSLLLPLTFALPPQAGLLLLGGIYMGSMYGGSITAILLHVPGAPEATFTSVEGFPMTLKGQARKALYLAIYSSSFGGLIGVLLLIFFTPIIAKVAVAFGPPEMFLLGLAGLTVIGALAGGKDLPKSYFSVGVGLIISCIGVDNMTNSNRFTFGFSSLKMGISIIPVVLGMFAISEMLMNLGNREGKITLVAQNKVSRLGTMRIFFSKWTTLIRATFLGVLIGALPGVGGTTASFVAYGNAKTMSKHPEEFGNGSVEGLIANEAANNAVVGSSLIPLLSLGIPGSGTAAIMLGALTVHGIIPGPELFIKHADIAYTFMIGMVFTVLFMLLIGLFGIRFFAKIVEVDLSYIIPLTIVFSLLGAYSDRNSMFDILMAVVMAFIAVVMKMNKFPVAPLVLGVVLGPIIESNLRTSLVLASAVKRPLPMFMAMRPLSVGLFVLVFLLL